LRTTLVDRCEFIIEKYIRKQMVRKTAGTVFTEG